MVLFLRPVGHAILSRSLRARKRREDATWGIRSIARFSTKGGRQIDEALGFFCNMSCMLYLLGNMLLYIFPSDLPNTYFMGAQEHMYARIEQHISPA